MAAKVRAACAGGIGAGIIPRLWPNTKAIDVVTTGSMEAYIPSLETYAGGVKDVCGQLYGASECYVGLNTKPLIRPDEVSYAIIPNMAYFEFLPLAQASNGPEEYLEQKLVSLLDVKVGHEYELVVTTYAGLYRYRLGDILRCTGLYNKTPEFYFVGRTNLALSGAFKKNHRTGAAICCHEGHLAFASIRAASGGLYQLLRHVFHARAVCHQLGGFSA